MFRLHVSHPQAPTTFTLPDALPTSGSHSVHTFGIHISFLKGFDYRVCYYRLCLNIKTLNSPLTVRWCSQIFNCEIRCRIMADVGVLLFFI